MTEKFKGDMYSDIPVQVKEVHLAKVREYVEGLWEKPSLDQLFIEMTINCNEHCRHCGSRCGDLKMQDQLTDEEIVNFLNNLKAKLKEDGKRLPFLNITGGEPTLRPGFANLMHEISSLGYLWGMTTNGTLIQTKEDVDKLLWAGLKTVSISIDGLEETHDWFRQSKGGYKKAMKAVDLLVESGLYNVMITTVVHKRNITELDELLEIVKQHNVDTWRVINVEPIGRAKDNKEITLEKEDYIKMLDFIKEKRATEKALEVCYGCNHWLGVDNEHRFRSWYFKCAAGIKTGGIFYNGDIGGCLDIERRPETMMGNIRNDDFLDVWNNKFQIFRQNRADKSDYCKNCSEKENCRGDGFHTWNLDENRPNLCMFEQYCK